MMPQSLTIGNPSLPGSFKRQRSAESREVLTRHISTAHKLPIDGQLKSNVRIPSYLDKSKGDISLTFQDLEWKQRFRLFHAYENPQTSPFRVDRSDIVLSRNRYSNVQPWEQSRIKLKTQIGGSDYVNASPIVLKTRGSTGDRQANGHMNDSDFFESKYIATQGPKDGQFTQFWHMVMQESDGDEGVIIMLTQCYEANKEKCAQYFPAAVNSTISLPASGLKGVQSGSMSNDGESQQITQENPSDTVTTTSVAYDSAVGCEVRTLKLTISNTTKTIHHFLFNGWPDFGRPEAEARVALLELTRRSKSIAKDSPRIVHCSAGVGRTGTFIALDFLVREIEEGRFLDISAYPTLKSPTYPHQPHDDRSKIGGGDVETWGKSGPPKVLTPTTEEFEENHNFKDDLIYTTVNALREQRMMMVMNELQFAFLYEVVREVFWATYRARPEGAVVKPGDSDLPKGKVPKVDADDDDNDGGGNYSEAETEIMDREGAYEEKEKDPYATVAPDMIQKEISKDT